MLLRRLGDGPRSAGDLGTGLAISRPAVSRHLRVLREAGLVVSTKEGTRRLYAVHPETLHELHAALDAMWGEALSRFKLLAENTDASPVVRHE